jgi:hypothetical protein
MFNPQKQKQMTELKTKERIAKEYIKQDFFQHEKPNGEVIMVSMDFRFFYRP